jgi:hypothetical protein
VKVDVILSQIDLGTMALPEFQRGYVWNREQVRGLMHSLYRKHPVGSLLTWITTTDSAKIRGDTEVAPGNIELILDGQQRMTTLYGLIRGKPPEFFDGNAQAFSGLYFNLVDEVFEFYAPTKMKDNPMWVSVTELMQSGVAQFTIALLNNPETKEDAERYINRLNAIASIRDVELHIEKVTGTDKTVDVVVDIFNRVNSGGTKLSKGDLALARVCASWPQARDEMKKPLSKWRTAGYDFRLEWLMRNVNAVATGRADFVALKDVTTERFSKSLADAEKAVDALLTLIASRLGLDHGAVLGGSAAIPLVSRYWVQRGSKALDHSERDKLLYWYVHTFLWGRYAGSTETVLQQDLTQIENLDGGLDRLIEQLRKNRVDLRLAPSDFVGWSRGARFYPLLYMLTRVHGAQDWGSGVKLSKHILGTTSGLELHHIFPKSLLYKHGYTTSQVNALANFTFLTQTTNLEISDRPPTEYLPEYMKKQPGAVASHWLPTDPELWKMENYEQFLETRRELLAKAANSFLGDLFSGKMEETEAVVDVLAAKPVMPIGGVSSEEEETLLIDTNVWVVDQHLPEGEFMLELSDETGADAIALLDLAWPEGLQTGLSKPVALLIDEPNETLEAANAAGYTYFTDAEDFKDYVRREILGLEPNEAQLVQA